MPGSLVSGCLVGYVISLLTGGRGSGAVALRTEFHDGTSRGGGRSDAPSSPHEEDEDSADEEGKDEDDGEGKDADAAGAEEE